MSFRSIKQWDVECNHCNRLDEAILMSIHNIQFHDKKIPKISLNICFELSEIFPRD